MSVTTPSLEQQQSQVRIDLAAMFRLTADFGWDDTIWNHITARVPGTDHHFYMHRFGLSYDEVCASNLIKVDEEGKVLEGPKDLNTAGFIIHSAIHLNHPEAKFVFHAHPASAIAATAFKEIPFLVQDSSMLYGNVGYHDWEGLSVDPDERFRIAENMGSNSCLVMRNHGFLTVGKTAGECFMNMYYLIRLCEVALSAKASSLPMDPGAPDLWSLASKQYEAFSPGKYEWPALKRKCDRLDPSYKF
ncbi:MAG: aldolase [Oceanospirillaceae bacterium]|jgi:ribulose-5-phosphate 4-epimerase/fuculose-1-phosphate aldolase|nr:aldolase [Oceanospirillaceae bacterium]|tara:strand:- start:1939 stop:2676 length:738 start_codon:yes stop_codon:yes gene_type:complete